MRKLLALTALATMTSSLLAVGPAGALTRPPRLGCPLHAATCIPAPDDEEPPPDPGPIVCVTDSQGVTICTLRG